MRPGYAVENWKVPVYSLVNLPGVLLGILGRDVPPGSPNPDLISDQKMSFSTTVFRSGLQAEIMSSLLRLERKQKNSSNPFRIRIFLFRSYSFGIETISTFIYFRSSLEKSYPILDQNGKSVYPLSDQNSAKTPPFGATHTYIAYIRKYPPPVVKLLVLS